MFRGIVHSVTTSSPEFIIFSQLIIMYGLYISFLAWALILSHQMVYGMFVPKANNDTGLVNNNSTAKLNPLAMPERLNGTPKLRRTSFSRIGSSQKFGDVLQHHNKLRRGLNPPAANMPRLVSSVCHF